MVPYTWHIQPRKESVKHMADVKGGYQRPTGTSFVSSSYEDHRRRTPPSGEPGTDYGCAYGSTLYSPEDGVVVDLSTSTGGGTGRYITIDLNDGQRVRSLHLSQINVFVGQRVSRGQAIGKTGASAWGKEWGVGAHVHESLFRVQAYNWGTLTDFEAQVGPDNDGPGGTPGGVFDQTVANEQNFLNAARNEKLVVDGIWLENSFTRDAFRRYQEYLKSRGWYSGEIDGRWGAGTQAGHEKFYPEWVAQTTPSPNPAYHKATVADLASLQYVNGLQKVAHLYGYGKGQAQSTWMDNAWGGGSSKGLQAFLDQNYGGSLAAWLRSKWGYRDNDDNWGPNMKAAAVRAEAGNYKAL